ncbi:MAG: hypothetical protein IJ885_00050 [Prevotella sp.]|jgi:hypothetical protein|nr:hypothetical protein [Prevotella sp.]
MNNITNEQIIQSARRQRQTINNRIDVEPWQSHRRKDRGIAAAIAVAASLISFIAGYGLHSKMAQPNKQSLAQTIQVQHDTIMHIETIRDTVYQTRVVTQYKERLLVRNTTEQPSSTPSQQSDVEQMACSMLCDDIPYALLATP